MGTSDTRIRAYTEQISNFTAKVRHQLRVFLGERDRQEVEYDSLPLSVKSLLTEKTTVESLGAGWWRVCGRYRDCQKGYVVSVEILAKNSELPFGRAKGIVWQEAVRHFATSSCTACNWANGVGWLALHLRPRGEDAIQDVSGD
jgi:hypothetical protein